jgi:hypothetical protein
MNIFMALSREILEYDKWFEECKELDNKGIIKGCEVQEFVPFENLARLIKPWDLQIHGVNLIGLSEQDTRCYFKHYESPSQVTGHKTKVTVHGADELDFHIAKDYDIELIVENTRGTRGFYCNPFCWDICHDVNSGNIDMTLDDKQQRAIANVHLSDIKDGEMHHPFQTNATLAKNTGALLHWVSCWLAIKRLKEYGYKSSVVFEAYINYFSGKTIQEKISQYYKQMETLMKGWNINNVKKEMDGKSI